MNILKPSFAAILFAGLYATTPLTSATGESAATIPISTWALRNQVSTVQISPNGEHLLILKITDGGKDHVLEIYKTNDLSKPFRRLNADPMEMISARWINDKYIFGAAWIVRRSKVKGPEQDVRDYKSYSYNLESNSFSQALGSFQIVQNLPKEPDTVLVASGRRSEIRGEVDPFAAFRPREFYRYNLETGARELVIKGKRKYFGVSFDDNGNPRIAQGFNGSTNENISYYRKPGDSSWKEYGERIDLDEHKNLYRFLGGFYGLQGIKHDDPNIGYMIDNRGEDKAALWEFDFNTGEFGKKLYGNPDADVLSIQTHSMRASGNNTVVAALYSGAKLEREWFDMEEKALYEGLEKKIPYSHSVSITSRSSDGNTMIIRNSGPRDPGSFWMQKDGKLFKLASRNPLINPVDLSDVEFIKYPARDGKIIPAYVTKPKGKGPFPLIVLPHGGPHVNEIVGYDEWGQLLANSGYMVLQPQYRMSVGWGKEHFDSAYGQHGLAMQDDKDDGALHLVDKGWVDPDRIAMFGWSYGGYAALVSTTREDNIYQCAIAGAAVADPEKTLRLRGGGSSAKALNDWAKRRGTIGINPINEVSKANIPLLMIHGDVDRRVLYFNLKDYKKAMDKAGKKAQYLTLKGADHFSTTLLQEHQTLLYTKLLDFLKNDCGPGGL